MAYTVPSVVSSGAVITAAHTNSIRTALTELQGEVPQASVTWSSPIAAGITIGSGTTSAHYQQIGPVVYCRFRFVLGAGSAITGAVQLSLPVAAMYTTDSFHGVGTAFDDSAALSYSLRVVQGSTTLAFIRALNASVTYLREDALSSTVPFTWAGPDAISATFWYFGA